MSTPRIGVGLACLLGVASGAGCGTSAPPATPAVAEPTTSAGPPEPVRLGFGDCAGETAAFVTGPRPAAFDREDVAAHMASLRPPPDGVETEEEVESAGVIGVLQTTEGGAFSTLTGTGEMMVGSEDPDVYGGLFGDEEGEMQGGFGTGVSGFDPGGGGTGWGTIGTGRYGTIGHGNGTSGYGTSGPSGTDSRRSVSPTVRIGNAVATGDLDKNIIRRYIRRKLPRIKYCYEKQLLIHPGLEGTVVTQFVIDQDGTVAGSTASGVNTEVAACVADVITTIQFPKPKGGGVVKVRYPFAFRSGEETQAEPEQQQPERARAEKEPAKKEPADKEHAEKQQPEEQPTTTAGEAAAPYVPGELNPLRDHAEAIERCLRGREPGVGVVELALGADGGVTASAGFGFGDAATAGCVAEATKAVRWADGAGAVHRCAVSYGTRDPGATRGVDLTTVAIHLDGEQVVDLTTYHPEADGEELVRPLSTPLAAEQRRLGYQPEAVVIEAGPLVVRPADATPMAWVYRVIESLDAAEAHWLLAVQDGGAWRLVRSVTLPVVPVPLGTGDAWDDPTSHLRYAGGSGRAISIEVGPDAVQVAVSSGEAPTTIPHVDGVVDQDRLRAVLDQHRKADFADRRRIDIGAGDQVRYRQVARAIETAQDAGFTDWTLVRASALAVQP
jgi:hypothetical protein